MIAEFHRTTSVGPHSAVPQLPRDDEELPPDDFDVGSLLDPKLLDPNPEGQPSSQDPEQDGPTDWGGIKLSVECSEAASPDDEQSTLPLEHFLLEYNLLQDGVTGPRPAGGALDKDADEAANEPEPIVLTQLPPDDADDPDAGSPFETDVGPLLEQLEPLEEEEDEQSAEPLEPPEPLDAPPRSGPLLVIGCATSRFHVCHRTRSQWACVAPFEDGLIGAGLQLDRILPDGQVQQLCALPEPARQILVHEREGWLLVAAQSGALWRVTLGTWQLQPLSMPSGLNFRGACNLVSVDDQPKLLTTSGALWDVVARATQLVRNPNVHLIRQISEPSGEYALAETNVGLRLIQLLSSSTVPTPFVTTGKATLLASAAGQLVAALPHGELCFVDRPNAPARRFVLAEPIIAATVGIAAGQVLSWLAIWVEPGLLRLVEIESAIATEIYTLPAKLDPNQRARLHWSASERVLYLHDSEQLLALKRLEA